MQQVWKWLCLCKNRWNNSLQTVWAYSKTKGAYKMNSEIKECVFIFAVLIFVILIIAGVMEYKNNNQEQTQGEKIAEKNFWTLVLCNQFNGNIIQSTENYDLCQINKKIFKSEWKNQWVLVEVNNGN